MKATTVTIERITTWVVGVAMATISTISACNGDADPTAAGTEQGTSATDGAPSATGTGGAGATASPTGADASDGSSDATGTDTQGTTGPGIPPVSGGCFPAGEAPASSAPHGLEMPTLQDEINTYTAWGLTWAPDAEPAFEGDPTYTVDDPDIHYGTESDDTWTHIMQYHRTGQMGYLDRANAWRDFHLGAFINCEGTDSYTFCFDRDAFGADHAVGWGLVSMYELNGDAEALAGAVAIGEQLQALWDGEDFGCLSNNACLNYGPRGASRHLILITRLADATGEARWEQFRDQMIDTFLAASEWDAQEGMFFQGEWSTDQAMGDGAYAAGTRVQSPFQIGVLSEALDQAYRATGREEIRDRMVAIAEFVFQRGLDPVYDYTGSSFGLVGGETWHNYGATEPVDFWDPVYTTSLVNTLVRGYRYTCDPKYYQEARHYFERGNRGIYGEPIETASAEGTVHHFVDTIFDSSSGDFFYGYNKGELQYTYLMFAPVEL